MRTSQFHGSTFSEDFGIGLVAEQRFSLSDGVIAATFGQSIAGEDIDKMRDAKRISQGISHERWLISPSIRNYLPVLCVASLSFLYRTFPLNKPNPQVLRCTDPRTDGKLGANHAFY